MPKLVSSGLQLSNAYIVMGLIGMPPPPFSDGGRPAVMRAGFREGFRAVPPSLGMEFFRAIPRSLGVPKLHGKTASQQGVDRKYAKPQQPRKRVIYYWYNLRMRLPLAREPFCMFPHRNNEFHPPPSRNPMMLQSQNYGRLQKALHLVNAKVERMLAARITSSSIRINRRHNSRHTSEGTHLKAC